MCNVTIKKENKYTNNYVENNCFYKNYRRCVCIQHLKKLVNQNHELLRNISLHTYMYTILTNVYNMYTCIQYQGILRKSCSLISVFVNYDYFMMC